MTEVSRKLPGPQFPDLRDWIDPFGLMELRPKLDFHLIRVEGVFEDEIHASYGDGILTVVVPIVPPAKAATRKIAVTAK